MVEDVTHMERLVRLEERDTSRGREIDDLRTALRDNTLATKSLTEIISKMQLTAAFDKGKERGMTLILGGGLSIILTLITNFLTHH